MVLSEKNLAEGIATAIAAHQQRFQERLDAAATETKQARAIEAT
jgi:hypothetical protein